MARNKGLRAVFKEMDNTWRIMLDDDELFRYTIDYVPRDYIIMVAVSHGKLPKEAIIDYDVADEHADEVLQWFEEKFFPTREFGEDLLRSFIRYMKEMRDSGELEDLFNQFSNRDDNSQEIADLTI